MKTPLSPHKDRSQRADAILAAAIPVFGRFGFKKTSVDDLAEAAGLSKQGLYLHFAGKDQIFVAAMQRYLDEGLLLVDAALGQEGVALVEKLVDAMNAWFGRHLMTFTPDSFDVIGAGDHLSAEAIEQYKSGFRDRIAAALKQSPEFSAGHPVSAEELAKVLFTFGLTWKEGRPTRAEFLENIRLCVRACLPHPAPQQVPRTSVAAQKTMTSQRLKDTP